MQSFGNNQDKQNHESLRPTSGHNKALERTPGVLRGWFGSFRCGGSGWGLAKGWPAGGICYTGAFTGTAATAQAQPVRRLRVGDTAPGAGTAGLGSQHRPAALSGLNCEPSLSGTRTGPKGNHGPSGNIKTARRMALLKVVVHKCKISILFCV